MAQTQRESSLLISEISRYAQLELTHGLIRATTPVYTKYSYKVSPSYTRTISADDSPSGRAVNKFGIKKSTVYHIDVDSVSRACNIPRSDIVRKLNDLNESAAISLTPAGVHNVYKVNQSLPKTKAEIEKLVSAIYQVMVRSLASGHNIPRPPFGDTLTLHLGGPREKFYPTDR